MAKILKPGKTKNTIAEYECGKCDSLVEFSRQDLHHDQRDGSYVVCPMCSTWIGDNVLKWVTK
jgi:DNA-directed RNA polymerase subunit RPC12/RpoP